MKEERVNERNMAQSKSQIPAGGYGLTIYVAVLKEGLNDGLVTSNFSIPYQFGFKIERKLSFGQRPASLLSTNSHLFSLIRPFPLTKFRIPS